MQDAHGFSESSELILYKDLIHLCVLVQYVVAIVVEMLLFFSFIQMTFLGITKYKR